jgi:hypothetical protein
VVEVNRQTPEIGVYYWLSMVSFWSLIGSLYHTINVALLEPSWPFHNTALIDE